ncbi:TPA: DNA sulfur modification protein DndD [Pseudomonas aeruginosa]|uniref:DNA sulfur modification protein DndD n=1 Tax=Pseudomonas aeruginosa TaxID=287 RepID=UPI00321A2455|nr:DNA sulfur modification protein DndD [Pseudomonas aeruginosa]
MIIDALSVLDFRLFSGAHKFDLTPKIKNGRHAPIVLFGGLNGGGKTTILNALKLALYGKGILGTSATISDYHAYLRDCIHRAHNSIAKPTRAAVELKFRYAQHGIISSYHLTRDWHVDRAGKIKEGLLIARDGHALSELSYDQAQSFLNELIPIGVSELFFFDGEKISSLAEETSGDALRESINKLLGLDLIERLDSDLAVLLKSRSLKKATKERHVKIVETEREFDTLHRQLESVRDKYLNLRLNIAEISHNLSKNGASISARGGAWSASKEEESANLDSLIAKKRAIEHTLHDILSGLLPLAIPKSLNEKLISQLAEEKRLTKAQVLSEYLERQERRFFAKLEETLKIGEDKKSILQEIFLQTFGSEVATPPPDQPNIHMLTDSHSAGIAHRLTIEVSSRQQRARDLVEQLQELDSAIETVGENLARVPDEKVLIPLFQEQSKLQGQLVILNEQKALLQEEAKGLLNQMSLRARRLDELHAEIAQSQEDARMHALAQKARDVLKEFSSRARVEKLKELEAQFYSSFNGLTRKKDRHLSIQINPASFEVTLIDDNGIAIRKDELSAGEKQIFAISILEALARTSGRSLPVVIDTPLGRLDSIHRKKLMENYFPKTSHQVIILSTDTEIDKSFYEGLNSSISHSYHLVYSPENRSTHVEEGYFWRWIDRA